MVGVGKLLKQAQKMQLKMEEAQEKLSHEVIEVSGGGGAVSIKISGSGEFKELTLDPEFLKEDPEFVSEAILQAVVDASEQAKKREVGEIGLLLGFGVDDEFANDDDPLHDRGSAYDKMF